LGLLPLGWAQDSDASKVLDAIEKEFQQEQKDLRATAQQEKDDEAVSQIYAEFYKGVVPEFAERFAVVARENKGTPIALRAWIKAVELAADAEVAPLAKEGLAAITSDHIDSEELASLSTNLRYAASGLGEDTVLEALRVIGERSPHRSVQASARFNRGAVLGDERAAGDPRIEEAKSIFTALQKDFADVEMYKGKSYGKAAESFLFALENLLVGKPCPDFEASDAEGVAFKLSDYKGKVVLVDFWGFW